MVLEGYTLNLFYKERSDFVTSWTFLFFTGRSLKSFFGVSFFYSHSLKSFFSFSNRSGRSLFNVFTV